LADIELVRVRVGVLRRSEGLDPLGSKSKVLGRVELLFLGLGLLLLLLGLLGLGLGLLSLGSLLFSLLLTLLELTMSGDTSNRTCVSCLPGSRQETH
jgi:hypothetical protein